MTGVNKYHNPCTKRKLLQFSFPAVLSGNNSWKQRVQYQFRFLTIIIVPFLTCFP